MDNKTNDILQLISDYIACSKYMCILLKEHYGISDETLLTAQKSRLIPKEGILEEKISYSFHGGGCYFKFEDGAIDVDFGPADRCDGFDLHKLYDFLIDSKSSICKELLDRDFFAKMFDQLVLEGTIIPPEWYPNPDLFYLKKDL